MADQPPPTFALPLFRRIALARREQPPPQPEAPRPLRLPPQTTTTIPPPARVPSPPSARVPTPPQPTREPSAPPSPPPQPPTTTTTTTMPPTRVPSPPQPTREPTPPPPPPPVATRFLPSPPPSPSPKKTISPRQENRQESPRDVKSFSPTPPSSPKPSPRAYMTPETEEPKFMEPTAKSISMQENHGNQKHNHKNNSTTTSSSKKEEKVASSPVSSWRKPPGTARSNNEEDGMRVITIGGENMGAYMDIGSRDRNHGRKLPQGNFFNSLKHASEESEHEISDVEEQSGRQNYKGRTKGKAKPVSAVVNSNVQGVNNSLLLGSTCSHASPGVHVTLSGGHRMKKKNSDQDEHHN